jgi:hypothetical protein
MPVNDESIAMVLWLSQSGTDPLSYVTPPGTTIALGIIPLHAEQILPVQLPYPKWTST